MNIYENTLRDCKAGIKAYQNINAASIGFAKMLELATTKDAVLMPSIFYWAVIRYVKPFLNSDSENGKIIYPTKHLKHVTGFSTPMHEHLISVRNTLIAHDDFTEIPPRILKFGVTTSEDNFFIPTSIVASNKCLSFPQDPSTVKNMQMHSQACLNGVHTKLLENIEKLRNLTLTEPKLALEGAQYTKDYGAAKIEVGGSNMNPPNFMNDEWLNSPVPDYSALHNGYMYEEAKVTKEFHGPEKITTPNGNVIEFLPNKLV